MDVAEPRCYGQREVIHRLGAAMPTAPLSPIDNYKNVLQNHYSDFSGRARRSEYWWFALINAAILVVTAIVRAIGGPIGAIGLILYLIVAFGTLIPSIALGIRRLHDTGKSGWFLLIAFIPIVGSIILLVFLFTDSHQGTNQYGPSPKY
jgi:uncharacterized membrane protein YhaH (DUF805 family)